MLHRTREGVLIEISRASFPNDAVYYKKVYSAIVVDTCKRDKTENNKKSKNVLKA